MDAKLRKHGTIGGSELMTSDAAAAKSFYQTSIDRRQESALIIHLLRAAQQECGFLFL